VKNDEIVVTAPPIKVTESFHGEMKISELGFHQFFVWFSTLRPGRYGSCFLKIS